MRTYKISVFHRYSTLWQFRCQIGKNADAAIVVLRSTKISLLFPPLFIRNDTMRAPHLLAWKWLVDNFRPSLWTSLCVCGGRRHWSWFLSSRDVHTRFRFFCLSIRRAWFEVGVFGNYCYRYVPTHLSPVHRRSATNEWKERKKNT